MEERGVGREKVEESETLSELGVEVSAESHQGPLGLPTQACPLSLEVQTIISTAPGRSSRGWLYDDGIYRSTKGK